MVADPSLVYEETKHKKRPQTHVLLVGVSWYPHLPGGGKPQIANAGGLGQLTSPSASARALATWFLDAYSGERPLGSLRLLTSEKKSKPFAHGKIKKARPPAAATFAQITDAVDGWVEAGDRNPANLMIFFFCGHGLGNEQAMALLPQDFGVRKKAAFMTAISFHGFRRGMRQCRALNQVFFVDACRSDSDLLDPDNPGQPILDAIPPPAELQNPVFWSTKLGAKSQAEANQPSFFTQALIAGLGGLGADLNATNNTWRVTTTRLADALPQEMRRVRRTQLPPADDLTPFSLNSLAGDPEVPVSVTCSPEAVHAKTSLACELNEQVLQSQAAPIPPRWDLMLRAIPEEYGFRAIPAAPYRVQVKNLLVRPPGQELEITLTKKKPG